MIETLERPSRSPASAGDLETLVRPILEMLEALTGLESTYLTTIDFNREVQTVVYSRNSGKIDVPEGLQLPWSDTLCKRSLESGLHVVANVREIWGDSPTTARFGIRAFASVPVCTSNGTVVGTLCGISRYRRELGSRAHQALNAFAKLMSDCLRREQLLEQLGFMNEHLQRTTRVDEVTGLANRRALNEELGKMLAHTSLDGSYVLVCMLDLGAPGEVNDYMGLTASDQFFRNCANRLTATMGGQAFLARINCDQFTLISRGPEDFDKATRLATAIASKACEATFGDYMFQNVVGRYEGAYAGCVAVRFLSAQQALQIAGEELLRVRRERIAFRGTRSLWRRND
ncbi:GGDEF domain-containing protein [Paraburkholderia oxyphila]|uniref:GGDEF domain-containing protein n=1 Tax=Paraburkholderia oxyphila TaxID=614212 RepID=UPI0004802AB3|nr:diguanylate cyclase [Paraburkholderia oxyphila]